MKHTLIIVLISILLSVKTYAQLSLINEAQNFIQQGKLSEAKEILDNASNEAPFKNSARAHYLKAFLYKDLYLKTEGASKESYRQVVLKTIEDAKPISSGTSFEAPLQQLTDFMGSTYFNNGVDFFNEGQYVEAIKGFSEFLKYTGDEVSEFVLDARYYSGVSYYVTENFDKALENYLFVYEQGYENPLLFNDLGALYLKKGELAKATSVVKEGLSKEASNQELLITQLNILSAQKNYSEAEKKVDAYLKLYPNDVEVLLLAGTIYEKNIAGDNSRKNELIEKSKKVYDKAVTLEPDNYHANYNLGVTLYNKGVEMINSKSYDLDLNELRNIIDESNGFFNTSLPYLEKSLESRTKDIELLKALRSIYYNLNMTDKFEEINSQITLME